MKKYLLCLMTILALFNACQKNEVSSSSENFTIHALIEDTDVTKTVMDESNNILWSGNDQIIAFLKSSYGHKYQVKPSFVGKSYADFSVVSSGNGSDLSAGNEWEHNVVYYPYSENIECLKSGANYELKVNLPSEQAYVPDSFANGSMAMVAMSESNNITFKNVLGGIKLQLKGTQKVKSIKIEGKNNEKLSGAAVVTAYTDGTKPAITMASSASESVTLNCGDGVQLSENATTEFIIALPPVTFRKGLTVTITDTKNESYTITSENENSVLRSSLLIMPSIEVCPESQPGDEDNNIVTTGECSDVTISKANFATLVNIPDDVMVYQVGVHYSLDEDPNSTNGETLAVSVNKKDTEKTVSLQATRLKMNTVYYYRSYVYIPARNEYYYGKIRTFRTQNIEKVTSGEYVDLGLNVKWASHNLGASSPEDVGDRYAWGETHVYTGSYAYESNGQLIDIGNNICGTGYDPAYASLGEGWRLPRYSEMTELFTNSSYAYTTYEGVSGYIVQGSNGNSIFIPYGNTNVYSGWHTDETGYSFDTYGNFAGFMTGELSVKSGNKGRVYSLMFESKEGSMWLWYVNGTLSRKAGQSVRPVYTK